MQGSVSNERAVLFQRIKEWDPPSWWIANNTPKSSVDRDKIKAAYATAKTCTICNNSDWSGEKGYLLDFAMILSSAEAACAGCMILRGILRVCTMMCAEPSFVFAYSTWWKAQSRWVVKFQYLNWEITTFQGRFGNDSTVLHRLPTAGPQHPWSVPQLPPELEVAPNTGSQHAVERTLAWLRDCKGNHELCRGANTKLPSRVLLIQGPHDVKLYESEGEVKPYVCLSHCWGKGSMIKTTTSTLDIYKQTIPWHELPLTFQEAISFAFRLGYRYMWIDSLCIQQDSVEDWRVEGSKMAHVYSGADLTLAAAAADSSPSGCFRQTPERPSTVYSYPDSDGSQLDVHIRPQLNGEAWEDNTLPLLRRGWTLQECLLSRRMINFTDEELVWGCRTKTACECSSVDHHYYSQNVRSPERSAEIFNTNAKDDPELWQRIVKAYNELGLTYEKDIFPALQGISKQMYQYKKSTYIAGLWESSIISDLLWLVEFPESVTRPSKWRAPSWSWASIIGPLSFGPRVKLEALCKYVTAHVVPAGEDEFGEILSAKLTLRGRCLRHDLEGSYQSATGSCDRIKYPDDPVWEGFGQVVREDCWPVSANSTKPHSTPMAPGERVKTLLVAETFFYHPWGEYQLLILRLMDAEEHIYERIGRMQLDKRFVSAVPDLLMGEEETIHIV